MAENSVLSCLTKNIHRSNIAQNGVVFKLRKGKTCTCSPFFWRFLENSCCNESFLCYIMHLAEKEALEANIVIHPLLNGKLRDGS
jgi:hypothetical protein